MTPQQTLTYPEISSQDEAIAKAWEQLAKQQDWVDNYLKNPKYDELVFIGSGSSYYQAQTMAATFRKWTGRTASALPSSDIFLVRDASVARNKNILLIGVSRSGESTEVILALESVKELPNWTVCGITCYEDSKLAQISESLISPLGKEKSTVMTRSLSSMTFMMQAAIALASGDPNLSKEMATVMAMSGDNVRKADAFISDFVQNNNFNKVIYLGIGSYYGLAQEVCLKLKEMTYTWTESYGTLEFRHGPKSVVDSGTLVVLMLSEGPRPYELKVAEEMKGYGATVLLVTASAGEDTAFADAVFELGGQELSDEARGVLYLPPLQYFGYYTAIKLNVDPDNPRNLTQVVKI
ncbi:SIS domain-containing protein [Paenibacillus beijingensis]|uniref:Iron dicitrate transport regulator FecR n=1 Tax=Paenibacillus beijingensis TaxID=1126833 RepID=A0A0D5NJX3_9BACL|nr:SIS domain-containing protein [Paenibacillus beijingensis]AJY75639.1 iron dicitrate transport regulator FecR [Paenibacillus beijingensis]